MKKTAVEWFYNELKELIKQSELTEMKPSEFNDREAKLFEQAEKMEKQQIIEAHTQGYVIGGGNGDLYDTEQYYNETF
jgi:molecular chaperone GrpE (heat shock protein)